MTQIDNKYSQGKIYTIKNKTDDTKIYVGSTTKPLQHRYNIHRASCKKGVGVSLYKYIKENDWGDWDIALYQLYPCESRAELDKKEGEVIRAIATINANIAGRSIKEWVADNKEHCDTYQKDYRQVPEHRLKNIQYQKIYRQNEEHRLKNLQYQRNYRQQKKAKN